MRSSAEGTTSYRVDRARVLRSVGLAAMVMGAAWVLLMVYRLLVDGTGTGLSLALAAVTVAVLCLSSWLVARPPTLLDLTADGYRIRHVRGAGTAAARWVDVDNVQTSAVVGDPVVVFTLSGGATSVLPISLLGAQAVAAQRDIHERLNAAYGYRRLPDSG